MPSIKEILHDERNREGGVLVLFLEGKFWKAYEQSAYTLTKLYNFKPSKRFIKLVGEDVISVGFPQEQLQKYLPTAVIEQDGKKCRVVVQYPYDELAFREWKSSTRIKEPKRKPVGPLDVPEEWLQKPQVMREENLPVFKMVYDLLLRLFHESRKLDRDFRYTLGEDLKHHLMRVEICIYHAHGEKQALRKVDYIVEAIDRMLEVKLAVRILHDSKQLSLKKYALLSEQMVEIEKNLNDWKKYHLNNIKQ
jgi:hypothetical protein